MSTMESKRTLEYKEGDYFVKPSKLVIFVKDFGLV